jgi:hypothetical protein
VTASRGQSASARRAAAVVVGSRLLLAVVAFVTTCTVGVQVRALYLRDPAHAERLPGLAGRLLGPWAHWDGVWFVRIAADGYKAHPHSEAFFPLYPLLVRAVAAGVGDYVVAGLIVSLACYAAAMVVLFILARAELGPRVALWSVVFISVFPTALFFQAVYSEAPFLLFTLLAFWWARGSRWPPACLAGFLAVMTRSTGLVILVPLAILWWEQRRGAAVRLPGGPRRFVPAEPPAGAARPGSASWLWLLLVPAGLAVYMTFLWLVFRNAWLFGSVQVAWGRQLTLPTTAVWRGAMETVRGLWWLATNGASAILGTHTASGGLQSDVIANALEFTGFAVAVAMLVACWRRLPAAYTLYAVAALLVPLLYSTEARPLYSVPRFVVVIFPLFMATAAALLPRPVRRWLLVALMLAMLVGSTVLFASFI